MIIAMWFTIVIGITLKQFEEKMSRLRYMCTPKRSDLIALTTPSGLIRHNLEGFYLSRLILSLRTIVKASKCC